MDNNTIRTNRTVFIQGTVQFSRICSHIKDDELAKNNQLRKSRGLMSIDKPYTTITVANAQILPDPSGFTPEDTFVQNKFYKEKARKDDPNAPWNFSIDSKSPYLPRVTKAINNNLANGVTEIPHLENELAQGVEVILTVRTFKSENFTNIGLSLDGIIVVGELRYRTPSSLEAALASRGITFQPASAAHTAEPVAQAEPAPVSAPTGNPYATQPAQTSVPQQVPQQQAYSMLPQPQNAAPFTPEPAQPQQMAMNPPIATAPQANVSDVSPWTCNNCGTTVAAGQKFCGNCGTTKPIAANPYAGQPQTDTQTGIVFNPDDPARNY